MKKHHIVLFSGGHSSAKTAIAVVKRYGKEAVTLLNHDINPRYEDPDIKRFKTEVAAYLGLPITYANIAGIADPNALPSQFAVSIAAKGFSVGNGKAFCTNRLKTQPFTAWLAAHHAPSSAVCYYGFDNDEQDRINTRRDVLRGMGYDTCFPLSEWADVLDSTAEIGIAPPRLLTRSSFMPIAWAVSRLAFNTGTWCIAPGPTCGKRPV